LLGGRVAEEIIFQESSTGAQNDLFRATDIARSMIREYGMSQVLGPVTFERERRPLFLETMLPPSAKDYSEATAQEIDREVSALISRAHDRAREILQGKKLILDRLAKLLLEKEVLEGDELRQILEEESNHS
jgi:cell division protease FtsH